MQLTGQWCWVRGKTPKGRILGRCEGSEVEEYTAHLTNYKTVVGTQ